MRTKVLQLFLFNFLFCVHLFAFSGGVQVQLLLPDHLPEFQSSLTLYGPTIHTNFNEHSFELQLSQGSDNRITGYLAELSYRYEIETPFFNGFFLMGGHYLWHSVIKSQNYQTGGLHLGPGISVSLGKGVSFPLSLRYHIQNNAMVSIGGGMLFRW